MPSREKTALLEKLGEIYLNEGVGAWKDLPENHGGNGNELSMVMKYLPDKYKERPQKHEFLTQTSKVPRRRAGISLLDPPKDVLTIKTYGNVDFVNIVVKRPLYDRLEEEAKRLETKPDVLIYHALILMLEKLK